MIFDVIVLLFCCLGSILSISIKISKNSPIKNPSEIRLEKADDFYNLIGFLADDNRINDSDTFLKNIKIDANKIPMKSLILNVENQSFPKNVDDLFESIEVSNNFDSIDNKQIPDETKWINVNYDYDLSKLDNSRIIFLIDDNDLGINNSRHTRQNQVTEDISKKSSDKEYNEDEELEYIIYWLVYWFFVLILCIVFFMFNMDPGYDSVIYRISNIRSKKDT